MIASRQNSRARERGSPRYRQPSSAPEKITRPAPSGQEKTTGAPLSDAERPDTGGERYGNDLARGNAGRLQHARLSQQLLGCRSRQQPGVGAGRAPVGQQDNGAASHFRELAQRVHFRGA